MARTEKEMRAKITADDRDFKRKTESAKKQGKSLGNTMSRIGKQIAVAFAGAFAFTSIIRGFKRMITTTAEFEKSLASLSAITGATGNDLSFYGDTARDLARKTTLSAAEIVDSFKLMGSARPELLKNKEALAAVTKEAIVLAEASGMQVVDATNALAKAMNQFNVPAAEAGRVINVLAAGSKYGAAEIPAVADAIKSMGTAANLANISLEESVAMIETLAEKGLSGAESGVMLRNVILMLQKEADHLNPRVVGISKALENLAAENLSSAEMTQMFGLRNQQAASILVENTKRIDELTKSVTGTNTAYEQHAIVTDTLQAKWTMFKDTLGDLTIRGDRFTESLKNSLSAATEWMQVMQDTASSKTLKWWEKLALSVNNLTGGLALNKEQLDALEKGRDKSLKSLGDLIDLEEKLLDVRGDGAEKGKEAEKTFNEQTASIAEFAGEIARLRESKEKLGAADKEEIARINQLTERYATAKDALENYRGAVEAILPPAEDFSHIMERSDEEILTFLGDLELVTDEFERMPDALLKIVDHMALATEAARYFGESVMWASVQGEMGLKEYSRTVANTARENIKAYMAEAIAATIKAHVGLGPVGLALAGLAAGAAAALFNTWVPAFAQGGAVSGPTLALVGEGPGVSRSNPEYIGTAAQLGQMGQGGGGTAKFLRISRGDLLFAVSESQSHSERSF